MSPTQYANPLQGTDSNREYSTGLCHPLVGVPRGLTYFTPQTSETPFIFDLSKQKLSGFRATHCPSPWMGDFGHFDIIPVVHDIGTLPHIRASAYNKHNQLSRPHLYETTLLRYNIHCRLTATRACAVFEFTYPPDAADRAALVIQTGAGLVSHGDISIEPTPTGLKITGISRANKGGAEPDFACHYVILVHNVSPKHLGTLDAKNLLPSTSLSAASLSADRAGAYAYFHPNPSSPVIVQVATSFISHDQALLNLSREVGHRSFDQVAESSRQAWDHWLNRIQPLRATETQLQILYSCLYRVGLFPTPLHEYDRANSPHHRSPYTGQIHPGLLYTNQGLWDAYHTVYPLLAVIDRQGYSEILQGFLEAYRQTGWFPRWPSPGLRQCMIGSHGDVIVAHAINSGITGFDPQDAYDAIRKNAYTPTDDPRLGRTALEDYLRLGYVPADAAPESVSWTLDNAHCDWCIAQVAAHLNHTQDAADLTRRSQNYRHLWHPTSRLMRPKNADGTWTTPWREFEWGTHYVEGGPWQHSLHVPHDPQGLAELHGGIPELLDRIDELFSLPPTYERGHYWEEIHEMTEMALATDTHGHSFGQYAHSNQPVHNYLFLPTALNHPERAAPHLARVMANLYTPTTFPGDEDNGEMSAWYLLTAAQKVPTTPGSGKLLPQPLPDTAPLITLHDPNDRHT